MKKFKDIGKPMPGTAVIFDAMNLAFRWKHSGQKVFAESYVETVKSFTRSYGNNRAIITADWGSSSFRKRIYPEYKGDREEKYANQTEEEAQRFLEFIEEYERALQLMEEEGFTVLRFKGVEADDIAAYIVQNRKRFGITEHTWLISTDGDWDLLLDTDVSRFSYTKRKEVTLDNWDEIYPVSQEYLLTLKCLVGGEDNIKGVPGVGPKRAEALIEQYGDIFDLADALPITGTAAYIKNLNATGRDALLLNAELMDLPTFCEEAIGPENVQRIEELLSVDG